MARSYVLFISMVNGSGADRERQLKL